MHQMSEVARLQKNLLDMVLAAGANCGVSPVLNKYYDSPQPGLRVSTHADAQVLLRACTCERLCFSDPRTAKRLKIVDLQRQAPHVVRLWKPVLHRGRMIHGMLSGIDLIIAPQNAPPCRVTLPHPALDSLWLNVALKAKQLPIDADLLARLRKRRLPKKVDIVFTWVNDQDPVWRANRARHTPEIATRDADDPARFANQDELLYALRGLFRYFDGHGRVYLVTDSQVPAFWGEFADRVTLIDHMQIMGPEVARPTFNSHVIESCLHRIPGLAAQYIYFNDDVILTNATGVYDFFDDGGRAKVFISQKTIIPSGAAAGWMLAADAAAVNTRDLLAQHFNHTVTHKFQHCPIAINKHVMEELETRFKEVFARLRQNRFRSLTDVAPSGSLYQQYALLTDYAVPGTVTYRYLRVTGWTFALRLFGIGLCRAQCRPVVTCLNAVTGGSGPWWNRFAMRWQMSRLLPDKTYAATWYDLLYYRVRAVMRRIGRF